MAFADGELRDPDILFDAGQAVRAAAIVGIEPLVAGWCAKRGPDDAGAWNAAALFLMRYWVEGGTPGPTLVHALAGALDRLGSADPRAERAGALDGIVCGLAIGHGRLAAGRDRAAIEDAFDRLKARRPLVDAQIAVRESVRGVLGTSRGG